MGKSAWMVLCVVGAAVMAAMAVVSTVMGGCEGMLDLASGGSVPMKCHWTFMADTFVGILGAVIGLLGLTCKEQTGRRAIAFVLIVCAVVAIVLTTPSGIGLCGMEDMHCHGTAHIVWALGGIAIVVGIVQALKAKPTDANLPKMKL